MGMTARLPHHRGMAKKIVVVRHDGPRATVVITAVDYVVVVVVEGFREKGFCGRRCQWPDVVVDDADTRAPLKNDALV